MISSLANQPIYLLHWDTFPDGETGFFLDPTGSIHEYAYLSKESNIYHCHVDSRLKETVADFVEGVYSVSSTRIDSHNPLNYFAGQLFFHADALKCEAGNAPCGKRCLPQGQVCRKKGGLLKGAAIATGGAAGLAALGAGALLAKTEKGRAAASESGQLAKQGKVGAAGRSLVRGVQEGGEEVVVKGAEKLGRGIAKDIAKGLTAGEGVTGKTAKALANEEGLLSKATQSFAKGARDVAVEEAKSVAQQKAKSIKEKIKDIATKDIAYLPGERKLREKVKEATNKGRK